MPPIVKCRKCPATHALIAMPLTDTEACFKELRAAGWLHFAVKGAGRHDWPWECPVCEPTHKPPPAYDGPMFGARAHAAREMTKELSLAVTAIAEEMKYATFRVGSKVSDRGELVIALIIPPKYEGEWDP